MNDATNKIKEYEMLRDEINRKVELQNSLLTFTITTVVAILTFGLVQEFPCRAYIFLMPFGIIIPMSMRIAYYRSAMARMSAYIIEYIEKDTNLGIQWETRNTEMVSFVLSDCSDDIRSSANRPNGNKDFGSFGSKTQKLLFGNYYECLVLSVLCYILFAYHYIQNSNLCFVTVLNLCWPTLLIKIEAFISVSMDSVNGSKAFWIKQWEAQKTRMRETKASKGQDEK